MDRKRLRTLFPGSFNFFQSTPEDLRLVMRDADAVVPQPLRIFLESEQATPIIGFPILMSEATTALREALEGYLQTEETLQIASLRKQHGDRKSNDTAWSRYQNVLETMTENAVRSSFGRRLPSVLWLYHSVAVSRLFKEMPRRLLRRDLELGKAHGDAIKYRIYDRFLDRVFGLTYEVVQRVAEEAEEQEKELFPTLLSRMRDNVLIMTEDHISTDLSELDSYCRGYLKIEGKEFRGRLARLQSWLTQELRSDDQLLSTAKHLLEVPDEEAAHSLLTRPGYVRFLAGRPGYDQSSFFSLNQIEIWENLLLKLKEFELLLSLRKFVLPVREQLGRLTCQSPPVRGKTRSNRTVILSESTRPLDFQTSWVIDPLVRRCGLIYDITDFSAIVSVLGRSGSEDQDSSYRSVFRFQRWVNQTARSHRLQLEKYLGDGALYSGRHPSLLLTMAIELQRYYIRALDEGFPFDRGMRVALNYGEYRLLPIEEGAFGTTRRYEFFGQGIVELSRLTTGKSMREIDEIRNLLVGIGYSPTEVETFFAPVMRQNVDLVDKTEESRGFHAYINQIGTLVNEGIVATKSFMQQLQRERAVQAAARAETEGRTYLVFTVGNGSEETFIGVRKLGMGSLKGLGKVPIYEVVDGKMWRDSPIDVETIGDLLQELDRDFTHLHRQAQNLADSALPE